MSMGGSQDLGYLDDSGLKVFWSSIAFKNLGPKSTCKY